MAAKTARARGSLSSGLTTAAAARTLRSHATFTSAHDRTSSPLSARLVKNYSGTLPVLQLDECTAITEYLDTLDGGPTLTGRTTREKGVIHIMSKCAELKLLDAVSVYFHHATPELGPDVEIYQNPSGGSGSATKP